MIGVDTTFFSHKEIEEGTLSLSTSIFSADILDAIAAMGKASNFTLIVSSFHSAYFKQRFPLYSQCVLRYLPQTILEALTHGKCHATSALKALGVYRKIVHSYNFNLLWFPFATCSTFVPTRYRALVTIHDLYRLHKGSPKEARAFKDLIASPNNTIVCVSECTKRDVIGSTGVNKLISVIPNSINLDISKEESIEALAGKEYILDINAYNAKKNTLTLLEAYNIIKAKIKQDLVLCGGYKDDEYYTRVLEYVKAQGLSSRVHIFLAIKEEQRNYLLRHASLFVTPSLYEGWGRTPVEAAIAGIPVISTKETSLYEATMGLVHYVEDPKSPRELSALIKELLRNYPSKEELLRVAKALKDTYTSSVCATRYLELFDSLKALDTPL